MKNYNRFIITTILVCFLIVLTSISVTASAASLYVGDRVYFGQYEQDNDRFNGDEVIEWRVLDIDRKNNRALVISEYLLDAHRSDSSSYRDWESSELCRWLNSNFLDAAFTTYEQNYISDTNGMKLFLLSESEASYYFSGSSDRTAVPTKFAIAHGAYKSKNTGFGWWWLRTPSDNGKNADYVTYAGALHDYDVKRDSGSVRPAMWIDLSAIS